MTKRLILLFCLLLAVLPVLSTTTCFSQVICATAEPTYLDDQKDQLREAQIYLISLGYLKGTADGKYGKKTEDALRTFQSQHGLTASGHLDQQTVDMLREKSSSAESIKGATALDVQQRLINLGYLTSTADGMWGQQSIDAWHFFQELNGLPITNRADSETLTALFSNEAKGLPEELDIGANGDQVKTLQEKLIQLGFLSGKADGAYGQITANAVTRLQQHLLAQGRSIIANGTATPLTLYYLDQNIDASYIHDVALYTEGVEAERVERRLSILGYMDATPDIYFDSYAVEALKAFQSDAGLEGTGVADRETFKVLFTTNAPHTDQCVLHGIKSGERGQVIKMVEEALLTSGMSIKLPNGRFNAEDEEAIINLYRYFKGNSELEPLFSYRGALSKNAVITLLDGIGIGTGNVKNTYEASRIQRRLHSLYYLPKEGVDGHFRTDSTNALREFQRVNGLPERGEADQATLSVLYSADALAKRLPYRVEVSLADQIVTVYALNDQSTYDVTRCFHCSTGLFNSTPRGIFLDGYPANRWHYFEKFDCWAQYSFSIEGNIMFHSVIYSEKDENTLIRGSVSNLGNPASHGCIRLTVEDAQWLYETCPRGSLVIVIY